MKKDNKLQQHVTFCTRMHTNSTVKDNGSQAELDTVQFLVDNLNIHTVGDYRLLVNYNIPMQGADAREVDIVVINKFGVFLLEVKSWVGQIEANDDCWIVDGRYRRENPLEAINSKARILYSRTFGEGGELSELRRVSITGIVVLTEGIDRFINLGARDSRAVVGLNHVLLQALTSTLLLHRGPGSRMLDSLDINRVRDAIYGKHTTRQTDLIGDFRILKELSFGDLFDAYEAQNVGDPNQHVRLKRYSLPALAQSETAIRQFKRSAAALSAIGSHTNILGTRHFFPDPERPDVFYEVTELVPGSKTRLDEIMAHANRPLPLKMQLDYLEQLCQALERAHTYRTPDGRKSPIYHRNICPETVFVTTDQVVKLADFDFAKYGQHTITVTDQTLIEKPFTAPEVLEHPSSANATSDIYALGILWYQLASVCTHNPKLNTKQAEKQIDELALPDAARALMKRMVAEVPSKRPQNVGEVLAELKELQRSL